VSGSAWPTRGHETGPGGEPVVVQVGEPSDAGGIGGTTSARQA